MHYRQGGDIKVGLYYNGANTTLIGNWAEYRCIETSTTRVLNEPLSWKPPWEEVQETLDQDPFSVFYSEWAQAVVCQPQGRLLQ